MKRVLFQSGNCAQPRLCKITQAAQAGKQEVLYSGLVELGGRITCEPPRLRLVVLCHHLPSMQLQYTIKRGFHR